MKDFLKNFIILFIAGIFIVLVSCLIVLLTLMSAALFFNVSQYTGIAMVGIIVLAALLTMIAGFALAMLGNVGRLAHKSRREKNKNN